MTNIVQFREIQQWILFPCISPITLRGRTDIGISRFSICARICESIKLFASITDDSLFLGRKITKPWFCAWGPDERVSPKVSYFTLLHFCRSYNLFFFSSNHRWRKSAKNSPFIIRLERNERKQRVPNFQLLHALMKS